MTVTVKSARDREQTKGSRMSWKRERIFKAIIIILVLGLVLASFFSVKTVYAQAGQITLKPTDDTYVDSSVPGLNHGNRTDLDIYWYTFPELVHSFGWLKFNASSVPYGAVIDEATLQLHTLSWYNEAFNVSAYSSSDNSWTEMTLTYANMPSYNTTPLDTKLVTTLVSSNGQWYNWSVVQAVQNTLNSNSKAVSIVLSEPSLTNSLFGLSFASKEYNATSEDWSQKLIVHWSSVVPEFPIFIVLPFFVIATLVAVTFTKRKPIARAHTLIT